jgi:hypothetical protein
MPNALASSLPKKLLDQQRVFAEITVLRQSGPVMSGAALL